jgi:glycogen debranching enzyme
MTYTPASPFLRRLRGRITLEEVAPEILDPRFQISPDDNHRVPFSGIPFSDRGSRILLFRRGPVLYIRLAERWTEWVEEVGDYRRRAPVVQEFLLTDERGNPVDFQMTAYPHILFFQTRLGEFWMAFLDEETLYLKLPNTRCGISFLAFATHGRTDRRGGEFKGDPAHRTTHRNIAYTTNAPILANTIAPNGEGYLQVSLQLDAAENSAVQLNITPRLGFNRSVLKAENVLRAAENHWSNWFASVPAVNEEYADQYYFAWWIMRIGLVSPRFYLTREAMIPSAIHYIGVWQWDAFFHALAYRYMDQRLAENQLRIMLDHQREDGMIPDAVHDEGVILEWQLPGSDVKTDVTKPPLIAWAALKLYSASGNREFLDEIYEPICRWNEWWLEKNDDDHDGIAQYNHGFSSGQDDSPLWDEGMPVETPGLNSYLVLQMDALAKMADILGLGGEGERWRGRAQALAEKMIAHFWDEQAGVFWATREHRPIRVLTPFNLAPLLTGRMPRAIAERLVAHLQDPKEFWSAYPIPTVALNDPKFNRSQMWRGPTWVNINYLFIDGLVRCGYQDLARELRDRTLALLMRHNDIYEYYDPITGLPPPYSASVFGWSSAVFVDLAIKASRGEII